MPTNTTELLLDSHRGPSCTRRAAGPLSETWHGPVRSAALAVWLRGSPSKGSALSRNTPLVDWHWMAVERLILVDMPRVRLPRRARHLVVLAVHNSAPPKRCRRARVVQSVYTANVCGRARRVYQPSHGRAIILQQIMLIDKIRASFAVVRANGRIGTSLLRPDTCGHQLHFTTGQPRFASAPAQALRKRSVDAAQAKTFAPTTGARTEFLEANVRKTDVASAHREGYGSSTGLRRLL